MGYQNLSLRINRGEAGVETNLSGPIAGSLQISCPTAAPELPFRAPGQVTTKPGPQALFSPPLIILPFDLPPSVSSQPSSIE